MKCITHRNREIVRYCKTCGAPICDECNAQFDGMCADCAQKEVNRAKREVIERIGFGVVGGIVGLMIVIGAIVSGETPKGSLPNQILQYLLLIIVCAGAPYGWNALGMITSKFFLFLPIIGWLIYFAVKIYLSFLIGWACAIPSIISAICLYKSNKAYENRIRAVRNME